MDCSSIVHSNPGFSEQRLVKAKLYLLTSYYWFHKDRGSLQLSSVDAAIIKKSLDKIIFLATIMRHVLDKS